MYYTARMKEPDDCNGCRTCVTACPEGGAIVAFSCGDGSCKVRVVERRCKGCELCVELCPRDSLELVLR